MAALAKHRAREPAARCLRVPAAAAAAATPRRYFTGAVCRQGLLDAVHHPARRPQGRTSGRRPKRDRALSLHAYTLPRSVTHGLLFGFLPKRPTRKVEAEVGHWAGAFVPYLRCSLDDHECVGQSEAHRDWRRATHLRQRGLVRSSGISDGETARSSRTTNGDLKSASEKKLEKKLLFSKIEFFTLTVTSS